MGKGIFEQNAGETVDYRLTMVGGETMTKKLRVFECTLQSFDGCISRKIRLTEMETPCGRIPIITNKEIQKFSHLSNIEIVEPHSEVVDILLGVENSDIMVVESSITGTNDSEPIAAYCPMGWYVQGGRPSDELSTANTIINFVSHSKLVTFQVI